MERNTLTTIKELQIGDRFYKVGDPKKNTLYIDRSRATKNIFPNI